MYIQNLNNCKIITINLIPSVIDRFCPVRQVSVDLIRNTRLHLDETTTRSSESLDRYYML